MVSSQFYPREAHLDTISAIFFDIGGVCLSDGWSLEQHKHIANKFGFDYDLFERRHRCVADAFDNGQMALVAYLEWTIFFAPRPFTPDDVMREIQSIMAPVPGTLQLVRALRNTGRYLLATLNNEPREFNEYRIEHFGLRALFTAFFSSCYLGLRKPQPEIYRRVLQITQRSGGECLFIDDNPMNVEVAQTLGMPAIQFVNATQLRADLIKAGIFF